MNKILVIGYYDHSNLGDEMFKDVFPKMFPSFELTFMNSDKIKNYISSLNQYYAIIFGGGDLIGDYFLNKLSIVRENFKGSIYGMCLGVPYYSMIKKGAFKDFDSVVVRIKSSVKEIQMVMGTEHVRYYPDFVTNIVPYKESYNPESMDVGIFTASGFKVPSLKFEIVKTLTKLIEDTPYIYHLVAFDTNDSNYNDIDFNMEIADEIKSDRIVVDKKKYNSYEMVENFRKYRLGICTRFHSHILSIVTGLPFVSFHYANKVTELIKQNDYEYKCEVFTDTQAKPKSFKSSDLISAFKLLDLNRVEVHEFIAKWCKRDQLILNTQSLDNLVKTNVKRYTRPHYLYMDRIDELKEKYGPMIGNTDEEILANDIIYDITRETTTQYKWGTIDNLKNKPDKLRGMIDWIWKDKRNKILSIPSINMDITSLANFNDLHRSGWQYCIEQMKAYNDPYGTIMDVYLDSTFGWSKDLYIKRGIIPYSSPWMGFFHHTPNTRYSLNSITKSVECLEFVQSLEMCQCIFVLSTWLKTWLSLKLKEYGYSKIPVFMIKHPTLLEVKKFNPVNLKNIVNVVNIGAWLRNPFSIYNVELPKMFKKYKLKGKNMEGYFPPNEINFTKSDIESNNNKSPFIYSLHEYLVKNNYLFKGKVEDFKDGDETSNIIKNKIQKKIDSVVTLDFLSNKEFDELLTHNIIFLDLYEASAVNTLIEAMARHCPIIVNKIPAVVEYLGEKYPLYYEDLSELKTLTMKKIINAHNYLKNTPLKSHLSSEIFIDSLLNNIKSLNIKCNLS